MVETLSNDINLSYVFLLGGGGGDETTLAKHRSGDTVDLAKRPLTTKKRPFHPSNASID